MEYFNITEAELWEYISKKADDITIQKVEKWIGSSDFDEALFTKIKNIYQYTHQENSSVELAKKRFFKTVKPKTAAWKNLLKYAAILIVLLSGVYFYSTLSPNKHQIVVQTTFGEQRNIDLPDGSKVWLNASSKLTYATETPRTLYLEGEAFFEVAKDTLHSFTVTTPNDITVTALGTSFNVKHYKNSPTTETKLLTGKLAVTSDLQFKKPVIMIPNDKVIFYRNTKKVIKSKMNHYESRIFWKERKIQFENKTFEEIAIDLEAQFGKQIRFKNVAIANAKFTGTFETSTPINQIFEILKMSKEFSYQLNTKDNEWIIE